MKNNKERMIIENAIDNNNDTKEILEDMLENFYNEGIKLSKKALEYTRFFLMKSDREDIKEYIEWFIYDYDEELKEHVFCDSLDETINSFLCSLGLNYRVGRNIKGKMRVFKNINKCDLNTRNKLELFLINSHNTYDIGTINYTLDEILTKIKDILSKNKFIKVELNGRELTINECNDIFHILHLEYSIYCDKSYIYSICRLF